MALGLVTESGGGDYADIIKYDARAGRMFRIDRQQFNGEWDTTSVEITNGFQAVFDFANIEVGWALFAVGIAPQFTMVPLGQPIPERPSETHKQGFRINTKLGKNCGDDKREFASCAKAVIGAMDGLHSLYEAGVKANPGKLPVIAMTGSIPIVSQGKGQSSTNYQPVFELVKWVSRPAELGGTATTTKAASPPPPPKTSADDDQDF